MVSSSTEVDQGNCFAVGASGKIVEIGEVDPRDRYALGPFKCIECGCVMVPHMGRVRAHHFKHHGPRTPACADETYLHFVAKTKLYETIRNAMATGTPYKIEFTRPLVCDRYEREFGHTCRSESEIEKWDITRSFDKVELETSYAEFIPDVLLSSSKHEKVLFLEIKVTHGCEEEKINSGVRIIEVAIFEKKDICRLQKGISLNDEYTLSYGLRDVEPREVRCQKPCDATGIAFVAFESGKTLVKSARFEELRKMKSWPATKFFKYIGLDNGYIPIDFIQVYFENSVEARFEKSIDVRSCLLCRKGGLGKNQKPIFCFEQGIETEINAAYDCKFYRPVTDAEEARRRFERSVRYLEQDSLNWRSRSSNFDWLSNPINRQWRPEWWASDDETELVED